MRFFRLYTDTHGYRHLPGFCRFILDHHLDSFVREQLSLSFEIGLPVLKQLSHFTEEQLITFSTASMREYLQQLSDNRALELIEKSLERWRADQLQIIGKSALVAEDITLINYVRSKTFRKFVPDYTSDTTTILELIDEIDGFLTGSTTASANTYILLLKDQIAKHEKNLLEAQHIAHIGSYELDLATYTSINTPEIYSIYGIEPGTGINHFMEFVHPQDRQRVEEAMTKALRDGIYESEYRFVKDGITKYIWAKGVVLYSNGQPAKLVGTVQDITDRKLAEQELLDKTIALERSNESLQQFAYVASHDLKEPLRKMSIYTDLVLLKEKNLSDASRINLNKLNAFAFQMRRMIDDIMAYSTLTQWEERTSYNIESSIQEAMELLEHNIAEKNAIVTYSNLPEIKMVPSQFRQLFLNLISNALKFSRPGVPPVITITHQWLTRQDVQVKHLAMADRYLQVYVQDNGIGFNQEFADKIFGLFSRLNSKSDYEGSGIGLAIAKRILDNHGGEISAASDKDKGTTFTFIIPQ